MTRATKAAHRDRTRGLPSRRGDADPIGPDRGGVCVNDALAMAWPGRRSIGGTRHASPVPTTYPQPKDIAPDVIMTGAGVSAEREILP